jgi:hypothetical protein
LSRRDAIGGLTEELLIKLIEIWRLLPVIVEEYARDGTLGYAGIYRDLIGLLIYPGVQNEDV